MSTEIELSNVTGQEKPMTLREQTFAAFYEAYGITDDKLRQALEQAATGLADSELTREALERLWYSRSMSWLRHGHERKEPQDILSDEAE